MLTEGKVNVYAEKVRFCFIILIVRCPPSEKINIMRAETHLGICNMRTEGALFNLTLQLPVAKLWSNKS